MTVSSWHFDETVSTSALSLFLLLGCQAPTGTVSPASQAKPVTPADSPAEVKVPAKDKHAVSAPTCEARIERSKEEPHVDKAKERPKGPVLKGHEGPNKTEVVLFVPVASGVVRHSLGTEGDPANAECDPSFHEDLQVTEGVAWVKWSTHTWDWSGSECRAVRTESHHLFVDAKTGKALGKADVVAEGSASPVVTFDPKAMLVRVQGHGCDTSDTLR